MRRIDCRAEYEKLLSVDIVACLVRIRELNAAQGVSLASRGEELVQLADAARVQSVEASNRVEGIVTTDERLKRLVREKTMPKAPGEREIAGYRDVLSMIRDSHDYIPLTSTMVLQLHAGLCKFSAASAGGVYRDWDGSVAESHAHGTTRESVVPLPARESADAMGALCEAYRTALEDPELDALLLIPMFVLDFLCVQPFREGNGRMSRLLALLLLFRAGFVVGKYVSIEKLIADTEESYCEAISGSSQGWSEGENDYGPFVRYVLGVVLTAYQDFDERCRRLGIGANLPKPEVVKAAARGYRGEFTKGKLMDDCRDVSQKTVERALRRMVERGDIVKVKSGRYAAYVWNNERD